MAIKTPNRINQTRNIYNNINKNKILPKNTQVKNKSNNKNANNNSFNQNSINQKPNNQNNVLKKEIYDFFVKLTNFEVKQNIKNMALYLNKDNWKKINIINLNEQINKKYIKIIKYKIFLNLPFGPINIDKNEIKKQLTNLNNFKESKNIKININKLYTKILNERNLVFSSSGFNLLFQIFDLYSYCLIIPTIKKKIITDIFNLYDYFVYSTLLMFNYDKINIEKLQQKKIIKEKDNNYVKANSNTKNIGNNINAISYNDLISLSKDLEFYQRYINLIQYLWHCKKEVLIKILGDEKFLFTILPALSPSVLKNNNNENTNKINMGNFIEKIICYECYWSLFKIIKRIVPTGKNNEMYLTQINKYKIILNEIRHFLYYPLNKIMIKNNSYISNFINNNWSLNSTNDNTDKINIYIQIMIDNIKDINNKLNMFLPISLKAKIRFIYITLYYMIYKIKEYFDKIKIINQHGLNMIIRDFKIFQNKLYEFINCNDNGNGNEVNNKLKNVIFDDVFNNLFEFFNNIIVNKNTFINNVGKNILPLYLINGLLNLNQSITNEEKKKIKVDLKCNCIKEMQIIEKILMKYN
jgi:hypothetical protein